MIRTNPRYENLDPDHRPHPLGTVLRWGVWERLTGRRRMAPRGPAAPRVPNPEVESYLQRDGEARLLWIGHASFLGSLGGANFLIDPVFSSRIGMVYRRHVEPGVGPEDLPDLSVLLVSHSHYDHLDVASLRMLPKDLPAVVPRGVGALLRRLGFRDIRELEWWGSCRVGSLRITLTPARHWSRRTLWDTNRRLWGGFVIEEEGRAIYHAGDTAFFDGFEEIGARFPELDAALMPIGAYQPARFMEHNHMNPEQAGEAFLQVGARSFVPMHWGTFRLTDEPLLEPVERLEAWWEEAPVPEDRRLLVPHVGEAIALPDV